MVKDFTPGFYSRIDPNKNKDLFDAEEMEVDTIKDSEKPNPAGNQHTLPDSALHSWTLCREICSQTAGSPWHVLPPVGDSTAQVFPDHREGDNVEDMKQVLKRSGKLVKQRMEKVDLQFFSMDKEMKKYSEEVAESQAEVFYEVWWAPTCWTG